MYIEDAGKPFVSITNHLLSEKEYINAMKYGVKYLRKEKWPAFVTILFLVLLVTCLVYIAPLILSSNILDRVQYLWSILCMFSVFIVFRYFIPKENESFIKKSYRTNQFIQEPQTILFYRDYFTVENKSEQRKLHRTDVEKALETTNLFIFRAKTGYLYIIEKQYVTQNDCMLLREYLKNTYVGNFLIVK